MDTVGRDGGDLGNFGSGTRSSKRPVPSAHACVGYFRLLLSCLLSKKCHSGLRDAEKKLIVRVQKMTWEFLDVGSSQGHPVIAIRGLDGAVG
jgi:hypothetical protein